MSVCVKRLGSGPDEKWLYDLAKVIFAATNPCAFNSKAAVTANWRDSRYQGSDKLR